MSTTDEPKPTTLVDATVLLQEGLGLAGDMHVKGDMPAAARQLLLTLIHYQATADPGDAAGAVAVCMEMLEGLRVEVDFELLLKAHIESHRIMVEARKSLDSGDQLRAALLAAMAHYLLLRSIDPTDSDRHAAVVWNTVNAFVDVYQGARLPELLKPRRTGTERPGRPKGTRDDRRTWNARTKAVIFLDTLVVERGVPREEAEEGVCDVLRQHGFKDVTTRALRDWRELLEEDASTLPSGCFEQFRLGTAELILAGGKEELLHYLSIELLLAGFARVPL